MVGQVSGVDQDVINVDYDEGMEKLPEHLIYETLEYGR